MLTLGELRERVRRVDEALMDGVDLVDNGIAVESGETGTFASARLALRELIAELSEINERSGIEMAFAALLAELEDDDANA